ncbi:hypothetical protein K3495_g1184 [Podosphaera aphanis]|nr:hypothetical protein K3495_g1184 [Podosphaera aphanis]
MSSSNASNTMDIYPYEDASSRNTRNTAETGGAGKAPLNVDESLKRFKLAIKDDTASPRAYKKMLEEAVNCIESLPRMKVHPTANSQPRSVNENSAITKLLREIKSIKATITQTQASSRLQGQSWAKVASKPQASETIIRIQDEEEKKTISKLTGEELVKKIGRAEIIGARKMVNGQVKVYFTGKETKEQIEINKDWTRKLAATAHIATPTFQVLVHDMPLSFEPENPEHLMRIQDANQLYTMGIRIERAAWLKKIKIPGKTAGSLIVWFNQAENADQVISKGIMWGYELKATEIFRSGFRAMQCYNCQNYGHIAKVCTADAKCGYCAGTHNSRDCSKKQETRCVNCGKRHASWNQAYPIRIAAKAKAVQNRIQDPGRFVVRETTQNDDWQIVGSRKRRAGTAGAQVVGADGDIIERRGPGRPKGSTKITNMTSAAEKRPSIINLATPPTLEMFRPVTRNNQTKASDALLCTMSQ